MTIRPKQTRFIRRVVYTLKRAYGFPVTFYKITSDTLNLETGTRSPVREYKKVEQVIILPSNLQREFEVAVKNFTYGGFYDTAIRKIIVDIPDLEGFEIEIDDYFIWDSKRWQVAQIFDLEYETSVLVIGRMVKGTKRYAIEDANVESTLQLTHNIVATIV